MMQYLMTICLFDCERAEQCASLTSFRGQYVILSGNKGILEIVQQGLYHQNIQTKIVEK